MPETLLQDAVFSGGVSKTWRTWRHKVQALDHVTLRVRCGSAFGLVGPNGAGKTTFVKIVNGAVRATSGIATVFGHRAGSREAARLIGYVPESDALPLHLTPLQLLGLQATMHGMDETDRHRRIPEVLDRMGIAGRGSTPLSRFSRGMKQRAGIAAAVLHRPRLLILDEPTDGLDPAARRTVLDLLRSLNREDGVTLIINSHLLNEIEELCDEVAMLNSGRLIRHGEVSSLTAGNGYTVMLTAATEALESELRERCVSTNRESGGMLRVTMASRDQLDWTLDQARATGALLTSMSANGSLENIYLNEVEQAQ